MEEREEVGAQAFYIDTIAFAAQSVDEFLQEKKYLNFSKMQMKVYIKPKCKFKLEPRETKSRMGLFWVHGYPGKFMCDCFCASTAKQIPQM